MTPTRRQSAEFQFRSWRVPQVARAIECPVEVLEDIRAFACGESSQPFQPGLEQGGVLFGVRRDDAIRIHTWRPIPCEHTDGPTLHLSNNDRMSLAVQLETARRTSDLKDLRPVGWFVSRSSGDVSLTVSDLEIYNGFFPEAWQIATVICPTGSGRARGAFFVRKSDDTAPSELGSQSFHLEPAHPVSIAAVSIAPMPIAPMPVARTAVARTAVTPSSSAPNIAPPTITSPPAPSAAPVAPVANPRLERMQEAPSFHIDEKLSARERGLWAILVVIALGIGALLLYQRNAPVANAPVAFRASNENQLVQLAWDANSRTIRESERGVIEVRDGTNSARLSLTSDQLLMGKLSYKPHSSSVRFALTVYPTKGAPVRESAELIVPAQNTPAKPSQRAAGEPASTDRNALERQVKRLRDDLARERARADQLQNLVRILEARLGMHPATPDGKKP